MGYDYFLNKYQTEVKTFNSLYGIPKGWECVMTELGSFNSLYGIHRTYWDELVDIAYHFQFPLWDTYATLFNP